MPLDGRRLLVIHGDQFGQVTRHARWVYRLGDRAYTLALHANAWTNALRRSLGYPYWSLSAMLKGKVKSAVNLTNDFERFVARYTREHGCAGVVCCHIHVPAIRRVEGIDYYDCGDWVEHCTALVEHVDGRIELVGTQGRVAQQQSHGRFEITFSGSPEPSMGCSCETRPMPRFVTSWSRQPTTTPPP